MNDLIKYTFVILLGYFICPGLVLGQDFECLTDDPPSGLKSAGVGCDDWMNYAPLEPDQVSIKRVSVTFHVFQKTDGTGNFPENATSDNWLENTALNHTNSTLQNLCEMNLSTSSPYLTKAQIEFVLEDIFYHQDDDGWDLYCPSPPNCNISATLGNSLYQTYVVNNAEVTNKYNSIHVFLGENEHGRGRASGIGDKDWIIMSGFYYYYLLQNHWSPALGLLHELGHSLDLMHTWGSNDDRCSDTPGAPLNNNCWNGDTCSNNVMDYNAGKCALTECQLGRMHWALMGHDIGDIGDCLLEDYLDYDASKSIIIDDGSSSTWNIDQYINGDLILDNSSTLTIKCNITLSVDGVIEIQDGAKLVVDGGTIENANVDVDIGGTLEIINDGKLIINTNDQCQISSGGVFDFTNGTIE